MALSLSSACLAIALADERGTLTLIERTDRWGGTYIAIADQHGTIEIADDLASAEARINGLRQRAA
jgi:hypothetical protein